MPLCFICCKHPRIKNHVVCKHCHNPSRCDKCMRRGELDDRMDKRRATIESRKKAQE